MWIWKKGQAPSSQGHSWHPSSHLLKYLVSHILLSSAKQETRVLCRAGTFRPCVRGKFFSGKQMGRGWSVWLHYKWEGHSYLPSKLSLCYPRTAHPCITGWGHHPQQEFVWIYSSMSGITSTSSIPWGQERAAQSWGIQRVRPRKKCLAICCWLWKHHNQWENFKICPTEPGVSEIAPVNGTEGWIKPETETSPSRES